MKYQPDYPVRFGSLVDARTWAQTCFPWYNDEHHHSGIALHTPHDVHYGLAGQRTIDRQSALLAAFQAHPERFPNGAPKPPQLDGAVWINKPKKDHDDSRMSHAPTRSPAPTHAPARAEETKIDLQ